MASRAIQLLWRARLGLLLGGAALLYVLALNPAPYLWGDNAHYVIVAKAIASGEGWRDIHAPGSPRFAYPIPLFPLALAPLVALFDYDLVPLKLFVAATGLVAVALAHQLFRQRLDERLALLLTALVAASPQVVSFSHQVMTEVPYLALSLAALLVLRRSGAQPRWNTPAALGAALLLAAALLTRTIAVALWAAAVLYLLLDAAGPLRTRVARVLLLGATGGLTWVVVNVPILREMAYLRELREGTAPAGSTAGGSLGARVLANLRGYAETLPETVYYGLYERPMTWLAAAVLLVLAVGFARALRRRTPAEYYVAIYGLVLLVYEPSNLGNTQRYLVPLVPFTLLYFALGVQAAAHAVAALARTARARTARGTRTVRRDPLTARPARLAAVPLLALLALNLLDTLQTSVWRTQPEMFDWARWGDVRGFERMARWVGEHSAPDAVVATTSTYLFHLWARRQVTWLPPAPADTSMAAAGALCAAEADYLALDSLPGRPTAADRALAAALARHPECAALVYEDGGNRVYRLRRAAPAAPAAATASTTRPAAALTTGTP